MSYCSEPSPVFTLSAHSPSPTPTSSGSADSPTFHTSVDRPSRLPKGMAGDIARLIANNEFLQEKLLHSLRMKEHLEGTLTIAYDTINQLPDILVQAEGYRRDAETLMSVNRQLWLGNEELAEQVRTALSSAAAATETAEELLSVNQQLMIRNDELADQLQWALNDEAGMAGSGHGGEQPDIERPASAGW